LGKFTIEENFNGEKEEKVFPISKSFALLLFLYDLDPLSGDVRKC
jgi:hypothetical protein